jgi:hypothetical protein
MNCTLVRQGSRQVRADGASNASATNSRASTLLALSLHLFHLVSESRQALAGDAPVTNRQRVVLFLL